MTSTLDIAGSGDIGSLTITLAGTHTWMGDLDFNLASPAGTSVAFMDTGDCGSVDDFDLTLDDDAAGVFPCPPAGGGTYQPTNPLAAYVAEDINGTWTMTINDAAGGDSGQLDSWSLNICSTSDPVTGPMISVPSPSVAFVQPTSWVRGAAIDVNNVGTEDLIWTIAEDSGANCDAPTDIPWLISMDSAGATTAAGTGETVSMVADSTGLAPGQYSASLCIDSNDPITPRVFVPVTLDVVVPLFADNFETNDMSQWADTHP